MLSRHAPGGPRPDPQRSRRRLHAALPPLGRGHRQVPARQPSRRRRRSRLPGPAQLLPPRRGAGRRRGAARGEGGWEVGDIFWPQATVADVNNNIWVANFSGRRLTELCGTSPRNCPPGKRQTGAAISPERTGYGFNGLVRNTGVAIDPSGNVWLANNWKDVPIQTNPGGYQIVAYLGMAAPLKTPQIGAPEAP